MQNPPTREIQSANAAPEVDNETLRDEIRRLRRDVDLLTKSRNVGQHLHDSGISLTHLVVTTLPASIRAYADLCSTTI
jgi:hypothetical protein